MKRFILVTFLFLGWAFYEVSGGANFVPEARVANVDPLATAETVTRANTTDMASLGQGSVPLVQPATAIPAAAAVVSAEPASFETTPAIAPVAATVAADVATSSTVVTADLRSVSGQRVNMRQGPGTSFGVVDTLPQGTLAEVIEVGADGWAKVRIVDTDQVGWMAERLLTKSNL